MGCLFRNRRCRLFSGALLIDETIGAGALVFCAEDAVPKGEEGLGKVGLDAPGLVVNVVVGGIVVGDELEGVPGKGVAAVVVNGLHGGKGEEAGALEGGHAGNFETNTGAESVEEKALKGVVVEGPVGVGDVETVMTRVESGVEPTVHVHQAMQEVLPGVENEDGDEELQSGDENVVDEAGDGQFPGGENGHVGVGLEEGIVAAGDGTSEQGVSGGHVLRDGGGVETNEGEHARDGALGETHASGPDGNVIAVLANVLGRIGELEEGAGDNLDELLNDDVAGDLVA